MDLHIDEDISHEQKELQLLKMHQNNKSKGKTSDIQNRGDVQKGLTLLHSVRFISQSRQRTKFIPFALKNSTGLPLKFATLTSLPAKVSFNPSVLLNSPTAHVPNVPTPAKWIHVNPGEEMPFDFVSRQKIRHKVSINYKQLNIVIV